MYRVILLLGLLLLPRIALAAPAGIIGTPDERAELISKDIGNERWAINLSLVQDAPFTITGNVFFPEGGDPAFVYCTVFRIDGSADDIAHAQFHFQCFGNGACHTPGACPAWQLISNDVSLPGSFFLPK
jgi:hypothetical protein